MRSSSLPWVALNLSTEKEAKAILERCQLSTVQSSDKHEIHHYCIVGFFEMLTLNEVIHDFLGVSLSSLG